MWEGFLTPSNMYGAPSRVPTTRTAAFWVCSPVVVFKQPHGSLDRLSCPRDTFLLFEVVYVHLRPLNSLQDHHRMFHAYFVYPNERGQHSEFAVRSRIVRVLVAVGRFPSGFIA